MARNPEGTLIEIFADPVQQLGMVVDVLRHQSLEEGDRTYGVRLSIPASTCRECGHTPDYPQAAVEWVLAPNHPIILGPTEAFCGGFKFGLQRPAEAE